MINKIRGALSLKYSFLGSVFFGFIVWILVYIILPIETPSISTETISFIICGLFALILGFYSFKFKFKAKDFSLNKYYYVILIVLFSSLFFRYLDLFYFRETRFNHTYIANKLLCNQNALKTPLLITLLSSIRVLFFIPIVYLIFKKSKDKLKWILAILLVFLANIEILLLGTRKPIFYLAIVIFLARAYSENYASIFNKKALIKITLTLFILFFFSFLVLNKRNNENNKNNKGLVTITDSRYNDFVTIEDYKIKEFYSDPYSLKTKSEIMLIHTGQYIVHGIFEFDYIVRNNFPKAKGLYSFNPIYKFTNRIGLTNKSFNIRLHHPREYVYVTFFGSLFIDFGWFALIVIFLFGVFQKIIFSIVNENIFAKLLWVVILSINLLMPIFNLATGSGLYIIIYLFIALLATLKWSTNKLKS